jgi:hypothetical protein
MSTYIEVFPNPRNPVKLHENLPCLQLWDIITFSAKPTSLSKIPIPFLTAQAYLRWNSWTQFNKRLWSFASNCSQSLLLADFKENHTLL